MSLGRTFSLVGVTTTAVMLLLVFAPVAVSQTAPVEEAESTQSDTIEEVTVYGTSMGTLEFKVNRAEENMFDVFNSINSDDQYDVHCGMREETKTKIKRWSCTPNYERKIAREAAADVFAGRSYKPDWATEKNKKQHLLEELRELAAQHPELREARDELVMAKHKLELERKSSEK